MQAASSLIIMAASTSKAAGSEAPMFMILDKNDIREPEIAECSKNARICNILLELFHILLIFHKKILFHICVRC
jgi:hypothetical protein